MPRDRGLVCLCRRELGRLYAWILQRAWRVDLDELFDKQFYLDSYPDVARAGMDPLAHFVLFGARERRQPHPKFDVDYYLTANPDVAAAGVNPLAHYLRDGWREDRRPNPIFDPAAYQENYPAAKPGTNPLLDYLRRCAAGEKVRPGIDLKRFLPEVVRREPAPGAGTVDLIVPIYRGLHQVRACLESVWSAPSGRPYELTLVDDCSPEPELARYVREVAAARGIALLENPRNLGFAGSVNRAMALHPDRDVVLLNSDTEVANDWIGRMVATAYADPAIGTVTPFSNNGEICSYPRPCRENPLPADCTLQELDRIFREVNAGRRVDLPTAVGFCMYIRRDCLRDVGLFDADAFGQGYGEENDFCMRAARRGWRHVLAADVFIHHAGGGSFGQRTKGLREDAMRTLRARYPDYERLVRRHALSDPAKPYRFAVSARSMKTSRKPVILAVSHALGGGLAQYLEELYESVKHQAEILVLRPSASGPVILQNLNPNDDFSFAVDPEQDYDDLLAILRSCGVARLHIQHLLGHRLDVGRLQRDLGVPFDFTVHDYFAICPQIHLADAGGRYCGEPDAAECNRCIAKRPPRPFVSIEDWRRKQAWLVTEADRVIAPSVDAALRLQRYFPGLSPVAAYHPGTPAPLLGPAPQRLPAGQPLRIAVLGAMAWHKGLANLRACAEKARRERLPLEFTVIGYVDPHIPGKQPYRSSGRYQNGHLPGLLRTSESHLIWFPAQWPETFSFTLSACIRLGLPAVVPDLGAFVERVAGRPWTWVIPWNWGPDELLQFFADIRERNFLAGHGPAVPPPHLAARPDFYEADYLRPLEGEAR